MSFILKEGDVLFKILNEQPNLIPKLISRFSSIPLWFYFPGRRDLTKSFYGIDPCKLTHVAFSLGEEGLLEYNEGTGLLDIGRFRGSGFVYTEEPDSETHKNNEYIVLRPINKNLSEKAYRKTLSVISCWKTFKSTSYGIRKLLNTALFQVRGPSIDKHFIEQTELKLLNQFSSKVRTQRANFFCSEYVAFVYLWAALELCNSGYFDDPLKIIGTMKVRISPAELFTRMLHHGQFIKIGYYQFN